MHEVEFMVYETVKRLVGLFSILDLLSKSSIQSCSEEMQGARTRMQAASATRSMSCDHRAHSFTCVRAHFCGENKVYSFGGTTDGARVHTPQALWGRRTRTDGGTRSVASNSIGATTGKLEGPVGECEGGGRREWQKEGEGRGKLD